MGSVVARVFKPIGKLLGIEPPKLPSTSAAERQAEDLGIPSEEELGKDLDPEQRRRVMEQRRRRQASQTERQRGLEGTGNGLIGGTTGSAGAPGSRLIGS